MNTQCDMEFLRTNAVIEPKSYFVLVRNGHLKDRVLRRFRERVGENILSEFTYSSLFDATLGFVFVAIGEKTARRKEDLPKLLGLAAQPGDPNGTFLLAFCDDTPALREYFKEAPWISGVEIIEELDLVPANADLIANYFASCEPYSRNFELDDSAFKGLVQSMLQTKLSFRQLSDQFDVLMFTAFDEEGRFREPIFITDKLRAQAQLMGTFRAFLAAPETDAATAFVAELGRLLETRLSGSEVLGALVRMTIAVIRKPTTERYQDQSQRRAMEQAVFTWAPLFLARYSELEHSLVRKRKEGAPAPLASRSALHRLTLEFADRLNAGDADTADRHLWNQLRFLARSISVSEGGRPNALRGLIELLATTLKKKSESEPTVQRLVIGFAELQFLSTYVEQESDREEQFEEVKSEKESKNELAEIYERNAKELEAFAQRLQSKSL